LDGDQTRWQKLEKMTEKYQSDRLVERVKAIGIYSYEVPGAPEVSIDTTLCAPDEAAQEILLYLGQRGYI
jgi:adenylylsulfate kinase-like enzyme